MYSTPRLASVRPQHPSSGRSGQNPWGLLLVSLFLSNPMANLGCTGMWNPTTSHHPHCSSLVQRPPPLTLGHCIQPGPCCCPHILLSAPHAGLALLRQVMAMHTGAGLQGVLWGSAAHKLHGHPRWSCTWCHEEPS